MFTLHSFYAVSTINERETQREREGESYVVVLITAFDHLSLDVP